MNKIFSLALMGLFVAGCQPAGTLEKIQIPESELNNAELGGKIEVYQYYVDRGHPIYISRFKDQPNVQTLTYKYGKSVRANVVIYDSIQAFRKAND